MPMFRVLGAVSLLVAIAGVASSAEVRLGPETALTPGWGLPQISVRVARSGNREILVWSDQHNDLLASASGPVTSVGLLGHSFDSPNLPSLAVAASDTNFLIVWYDNTNRMMAQRVAFDGQVLDTPPIILSADSPGSPSIASDGSTFLVSWCAASSVFTVRLANDGTIRSRSTFVTALNESGGYPASPKVVWTGAQFFLGYARSYSSCTSPCRSWTDIGGMPLDATGQALPLKLFAYLYGFDQGVDPYSASLALASGGGSVTFAWWADRDGVIAIAQANADGTPIVEPHAVSKAQHSNNYCPITPAIGWDGAEIVVAWIECDTTLRASRLNQFGSPIEEPFIVATNVPWTPAGPSIAPTPDGVVITYSRPDATNGNTPRAFQRSLARLSLQRRRGVVH